MSTIHHGLRFTQCQQDMPHLVYPFAEEYALLDGVENDGDQYGYRIDAPCIFCVGSLKTLTADSSDEAIAFINRMRAENAQQEGVAADAGPRVVYYRLAKHLAKRNGQAASFRDFAADFVKPSPFPEAEAMQDARLMWLRFAIGLGRV